MSSEPAPEDRRLLALRVVAIVVVAAVLFLLWSNRALFDQQTIRALLTNNPWAPAAFILLHILASQIFVPRTVLALVAGLVFGLWWGIVLASAGAMAGALTGFALARYLHAGLFRLDRLPKFAALIGRLERGGWRAVALIRLIPVMPHTPVNFALGLTTLPLATYTGGTFVGLLPQTLVFVSLGAAGGQALSGTWYWLDPALITVLAIGMAVLLRRGKPV